jgi:serine protease Do
MSSPARWAFALFAAVLSVGPTTPPVMAEVPGHTLADVVAEVVPAVVAISVTRVDAKGVAEPIIGSGFIIDQTGLILTNKHVIANASKIQVNLNDGTTLDARLVGQAQRTDIALLRVFVDTPLPMVHFGDSDKLRVGDTVIAIGNPLGFNSTVTVGIVSGLNRDIMESPYDEYIQTDAAINHGNSGGPLVDTKGDVIGMNSVIVAPRNSGGSIGLGFAIPSNMLKFVSDQLQKYGHVEPGWIGARFQQVTPQLRQSLGLQASTNGAIVLYVMPSGPAATAGLQVGDVVLGFNGQMIDDVRALARAIAMAPIGHPSTLQVWRASTRQSITVVPVLDPDSGVATASATPAKPVAPPADMPMRLGLQLSDLTQPIRASYDIGASQGGVVITAVASDSAAADAGLQSGDLIERVENCGISSVTSVRMCLRTMSTTGHHYVAMLIQHHGTDTDQWVAVEISAID